MNFSWSKAGRTEGRPRRYHKPAPVAPAEVEQLLIARYVGETAKVTAPTLADLQAALVDFEMSEAPPVDYTLEDFQVLASGMTRYEAVFTVSGGDTQGEVIYEVHVPAFTEVVATIMFSGHGAAPLLVVVADASRVQTKVVERIPYHPHP